MMATLKTLIRGLRAGIRTALRNVGSVLKHLWTELKDSGCRIAAAIADKVRRLRRRLSRRQEVNRAELIDNLQELLAELQPLAQAA